MIELKNVCFERDGNKILDNISFIVEKGTFTSIIGSSGCGKSIIGKTLLGLVEFDDIKRHMIHQDILISFGNWCPEWDVDMAVCSVE